MSWQKSWLIRGNGTPAEKNLLFRMDLLRTGPRRGTEGKEFKAKHKAELELEGISWGLSKFSYHCLHERKDLLRHLPDKGSMKSDL